MSGVNEDVHRTSTPEHPQTPNAYNHEHHGMGNPETANMYAPDHTAFDRRQYPIIDDGDVLIISPTGRQWKLESHLLSNASPIFRALFVGTVPRHVSKKMRAAGDTIKFKLVMEPEPRAAGLDPNGLRFREFVAVNPNIKGKLSIPPNINGLGESESYNKLYDNFFRILYHQEPEFTNDVDGQNQARSYICEATMLLQAAWYLDAVAAVRSQIESAFLRLNQVLWTHISSKPESWVQVAGKLESPLMFREAMLHLVGRYHLKDGVNMNTLRDPVYGIIGAKIAALVDKKATELKHLKLTTERHLLEFYPNSMAHNENAVAGKESYGKDIYLWIALSLVRQYISSAYMSNFHHRAEDGGLSFYRTIGSAEASYIRQKSLEGFFKNFEMSTKGKICLYRKLAIVKEEIKPLVGPLLKDLSQATRENPHVPRFNHLTCTTIAEDEFPWYQAPPPTPNISSFGMNSDSDSE